MTNLDRCYNIFDLRDAAQRRLPQDLPRCRIGDRLRGRSRRRHSRHLQDQSKLNIQWHRVLELLWV